MDGHQQTDDVRLDAHAAEQTPELTAPLVYVPALFLPSLSLLALGFWDEILNGKLTQLGDGKLTQLGDRIDDDGGGW